MYSLHGKSPPLSPVFIAGLIARPLPLLLLQPAVSAAFAVLMRRYPNLFDRLSGFGDPVFIIDPTDLPIVFELNINPRRPRLYVSRQGSTNASATIRGPLLALVDLMEGRVDGDALFFSRVLAVEGNTEMVVALRNAIDDASIDIRGDILKSLGPMATPARAVFKLGDVAYSRLSEDLDLLAASLSASQANKTKAGDPKT
ncbi:MAG: SCP2 sterol-binding domain-containing protein [Rhodospirillaceae bacterium]|nr:SCP2 sterol-binding domain-containing protein [Rhodospirillaceae bacterium]